MKKDLVRVIEIPEGVTVLVSGSEIKVSGNGKELIRSFDLPKIELKVEENKITLSVKGASRRESALIGTAWAHIKNMIKGVNEGFEYKLEICNVHFPMNVKAEGDKITIKSF